MSSPVDMAQPRSRRLDAQTYGGSDGCGHGEARDGLITYRSPPGMKNAA